MTRIEVEIATFLSFQSQLQSRGFQITQFDEFGFAIKGAGSTRARDNSVHSSDAQNSAKIDFMVTGLTHGDEVVGIEAINLILEKLLVQATPPKLTLGFLLNNIPAARAGVRYIEKDLNRSFIITNPQCLEEHRAAQISKYISNVSFLIDYHQTIEPTESPFFIIQHYPHLVELAHELAPDLPIVTFPPMGLSYSGKTLNEFAYSIGVPSLALEWGQKGFSKTMASQACDLFFKAMNRIVDAGGSEKFRAELNSQKTKSHKIDVYYLKESVMNHHRGRLNPGLNGFHQVKAGQQIGQSDVGPILAPYDGRVFFPKYGRLAEVSPELCEVGVLIDYRDI